MRDLFSQTPIQDKICSYLTFEEAIPLQTVLKSQTLKYPFVVQTQKGDLVILSEITALTIRVYSFLQRCKDVNEAFYLAVQKEDIPVFQYLLGEIGGGDHRKTTLNISLLSAVKTGGKIVKLLLEEGADPNWHFHDEYPLILAAGKGHLQSINDLLDAGAEIDHYEHFCNPLTAAIHYDQLPAIILLLERGANPHIEIAQETPLLMIARLGHDSILEWMLDHGFDVNSHRSWKISDEEPECSGESLLLNAVAFGRTSTAQLLVKRGADINYIPDGSRYGIFNHAIISNNFEIIDCLISAGVSQENINGGFGLAAEAGRVKILNHLYKHGITSEVVTNSLQYAITNNHPDTVKYLVELGADLQYRGSSGKTALELAKMRHCPPIIQFLEERTN